MLLPPKIAHSLGFSRPGEILRNLLVEASATQAAWNAVQASIGKLFGCRLLPPVHTRPGAVLLLDESCAHLHPTLQSAVYGELKSAATHRGSQIIADTHSDVFIAAAAPDRRIVME